MDEDSFAPEHPTIWHLFFVVLFVGSFLVAAGLAIGGPLGMYLAAATGVSLLLIPLKYVVGSFRKRRRDSVDG
jgi:hypothetical protein